jgi:tRNA pseudouridine38-40 synthase
MMSTRTFKLTIAYDGTDFFGWQRQATERTVQAVIEDALQPIEGQAVVITGAGRTDTGVHAEGQVASLSLASSIDTGDLQRALNATLPLDVRVLDAAEVRADFNARFDARAKTYRYALWSGEVMLPALRRTTWHVPYRLDLEQMREAAAHLVGSHDFAAFQATGSDVTTTVLEITSSTIDRGPSDRLITYKVTGSGFLRHMVRNIVGTIVDVGRGRIPASGLAEILASRDRARASATAPAHGLTLLRVDY